jgi:hypothetical protein
MNCFIKPAPQLTRAQISRFDRCGKGSELHCTTWEPFGPESLAVDPPARAVVEMDEDDPTVAGSAAVPEDKLQSANKAMRPGNAAVSPLPIES